MNSIHFVLEKIETNEDNKIRRWQDVAGSIFGISAPIYNNGVCPAGVLLIPDENALPSLARAIFAAEENLLSYKLIFNGDAGEWHRTP
jgi:hypothetical protein